jgi:nitrogen fixation protein NifU and related proteins
MFRLFATPRNESVAAIVRFCNLLLNFAFKLKTAGLLDHFRNPRNAGKLPDATAEVQATNPVCGDILELSARVESGAIREVRFLCRGCTTSIASASFLTERLTGCMVAEAPAITAETISEALGGLPPATFHGAQLAADALSLLLAKLA